MAKNSKKTAKDIIPLGDKVLVKPAIQEDTKSPMGIIIPDSAKKEKPEQGEVIAVGEGKRNDKGELIKPRVKVGDTVMFSKYGFDEVTVDDVEYYIVGESNILAVIK